MRPLVLQCDALILTCIDYRFPHLTCDYLDSRGLIGNYDSFALPGSSLGACCEEYPHWNQAFDEVVNLAIKLHTIKKVIFINHEECGAFQQLRGVPDRKEDEIPMHLEQAKITKAWFEKKFPQLESEFQYMKLNGEVVTLLP